MSVGSAFGEQQRLIQAFLERSLERARLEEELPRARTAALQSAGQRQQAELEQQSAAYEQQRRCLQTEWRQQQEIAEQTYTHGRTEAEADHGQDRAQAQQRSARTLKRAKQGWQEARWNAEAIYDAARDNPQLQLAETKQALEAELAGVHAVAAEVEQALRRRGKLYQLIPQAVAAQALASDPREQLRAARREVVAERSALDHQWASRFWEGDRRFGLFFLVWLIATPVAVFSFGLLNWYWMAVSVSAALLVTGATYFGLYPQAKQQTTATGEAVRRAASTARAAAAEALRTAELQAERQAHALSEQRTAELSAADATWEQVSRDQQAQLQRELAADDERVRTRLEAFTCQRKDHLQRAEDRYRPLLQQREADHLRSRAELEARHRQEWNDLEREHESAWRELADRWRQQVAAYELAAAEQRTYCEARFPAWQSGCEGELPAAHEVPSCIRWGAFTVAPAATPGGVPRHTDLVAPAEQLSWPALLCFPDHGSLLLEAEDRGREVAVQLLQNAMLRLLIAFPPGKVRFTILDPTGLGENFSAFMHLTDFDERMVSSRIWTEAAHIQQRLADLTGHMENVIQKYLRSDFASIQEYNEYAGEVAEPFHFLVAANFPTNFGDDAIRRLLSIATNGPRCGVHTLMSVDRRQKIPRQFDINDLRSHAVTLAWEQDRFVWQQEEWRQFPLTIEQPPDDGVMTSMIRRAGERARDAGNVEVPFDWVAPAEECWWTGDSRRGLEVPLGRAGATQRQRLQLGAGTSQHVLIAGKTGSGKSTLMHALITNLALHYSPSEVAFYLVDFKKGVEFKTYAEHGLPHARVIAIESEREFGLSVLQRLDDELKHRGDAFRAAGVQDLPGYRQTCPESAMPRLLLVIDEFQELFVRDDKIALDASLLLDRLVRQGRAFGIHVLLGTQTLAGAYSLARSTIGQMAVRIALQCSEGDAHLILSEDNTAARLLGRPGEAIYNDANGLVEGNHPFQVVWLPEREREAYLEQLARLQHERGVTSPPPVVFEGNVPADPRENTALAELLALERWPPPPAAPQIWLGAAVAIKPPTAAVMGRHSGANLLIVGQREEAAAALFATAAAGLAAQLPAGPTDGAQFCLLHPGQSEHWARLTAAVPHQVESVGPPGVEPLITRLYEEVQRRTTQQVTAAPPWFLFVYDLSRFRALRQVEDDYGLGSLSADAALTVVDKWKAILRDGPECGVHSVVWCDSYHNLQRSLDRRLLREFELRVLFQMNTADSSQLIDSPAAGQLGIHPALFYDDGHGSLEKFLPYRIPHQQWWEALAASFRARNGIQNETGCAL